MSADPSLNRTGVVWATVFLTALSLFGIASVVFLDLSNPIVFEPVVIALLAGTIPAIVTVPMLLACSKPGNLKLLLGAILMWLQALAICVAVVLASIIVIRGSL